MPSLTYIQYVQLVFGSLDAADDMSEVCQSHIQTIVRMNLFWAILDEEYRCNQTIESCCGKLLEITPE